MKKLTLLGTYLMSVSSFAVYANDSAIDQSLVVASIQQTLSESLADISAENLLVDADALLATISSYASTLRTAKETDSVANNTVQVLAD